jgi:adenylate cyclase class IV
MQPFQSTLNPREAIMYEAEQKYRVKKRHFGPIIGKLLRRLATATTEIQHDFYLCSDDPELTERVRRTETAGGIDHVKTEKRKYRQKGCPNTNVEKNKNISKKRAENLINIRQATAFDHPLICVKNPRVEFLVSFRGLDVKVCLDVKVTSGDGIKLGRFVEFERECETEAEIAEAHVVSSALARSILPKSAVREWRGYRTMLVEVLAEGAGKKRRRQEQKKKQALKEKHKAKVAAKLAAEKRARKQRLAERSASKADKIAS